jgi:hypothetical protein
MTPDLPRKQASYSIISATVAPASVGAGTSAEQTFAIPGLRGPVAATPSSAATPGDFVVASNPLTAQAGLAIGTARVTATDTVGITFVNSSAGAIVPTTGTYLFLVVRQNNILTTVDG